MARSESQARTTSIVSLSLSLLAVVGCGSSSSAESTADTGASASDTATTPTSCPAGALNLTNDGPVASTTSLRSDGTSLYYATIPDPATKSYDDPHFVMRLPVGGGTPTKLATGTHGLALSTLGLDDGNVYYFLDKALNRAPKAGGAASAVYTPTALLTLAMTFALDDTSIWFVDGDGGLSKMNKDGSSRTSVWKDAKIVIGSLVVDADHVYFVGHPPTSFAADAGPRAPDQVYSLPKTGGTPTSLATISSDPNLEESIWQLALDGDTLVYSTNTALLKSGVTTQFGIYALPKGGGAVTNVVALGKNSGPAFAAAGGNVYFGGPVGGLRKVSEAGGTATELASTTDGLGAVTTDATNVYYEVRGCFFKAAR